MLLLFVYILCWYNDNNIVLPPSNASNKLTIIGNTLLSTSSYFKLVSYHRALYFSTFQQ